MLCLFASLSPGLVAMQVASASTETREAFAARVEPICNSTAPAIESLLSGTKRMANNGRPGAAGRRFIRASNIFAGTVRQVSSVHRPAPDTARLGEWIDRLRGVKESMRRLGRALKQRD